MKNPNEGPFPLPVSLIFLPLISLYFSRGLGAQFLFVMRYFLPYRIL